jgi:hypothetical protein
METETKRVVVRFRASELRLGSVPAYLRAMQGPLALVMLDRGAGRGTESWMEQPSQGERAVTETVERCNITV